MKTTLTTKETNQKIQTFIALFKEGVEAWIKAGEILVELVESDPHTYDYIIQECPQLNAGILGRFEQLGRKLLHPQLLLTASPGFAKLTTMPFSLQERYLEEPIPIIVEIDGRTDVAMVQAKNMTKEQADQIFTTGRIRTEGEQKAWILQRQQNAVKPTPAFSKPWTIKGSKVLINGLEFTRKELAGILAQMD